MCRGDGSHRGAASESVRSMVNDYHLRASARPAQRGPRTISCRVVTGWREGASQSLSFSLMYYQIVNNGGGRWVLIAETARVGLRE